MKLMVFGKRIPTWLLLGGLVMAASGAGVGTILAGGIGGDMPVTVSQALLVGVPYFPESDADWTDHDGTVAGVTRQTMTYHHSKPDRWIGVRNDEKTGFQAAAEIDQGDKYLVQICFKNASDQDLVAQLDLNIPAGIEVEIFGSDEESQDNHDGDLNGDDNVTNVTRVGPASWKFIVRADAEYRGISDDDFDADEDPWQDCIGIQVKSDDTTPPGFYGLRAKVKQIAF